MDTLNCSLCENHMCMFLAMWIWQPKGAWGGLLLFANISHRGGWDSSNPGSVALGNPRRCSPEGVHSAASQSLLDHGQMNFLLCVYLRETVLRDTSTWNFGCLEILLTFRLSSAAAATQAGRGTSKPTVFVLNNSELRKHFRNFPILAKSLYL